MSTTRPRTYLFALVDGGGTVPPELGAARRLVERGHRVTVLAEDSMRLDVEASGAAFRPWSAAPNRPSRHPDDDPYRDWECRGPRQLFARLLERQFVGPAPAYAADTAAAIDELAPDLVVTSMFAYGAMISAEAAGVPFDVLAPNAYPFPVGGRPIFGTGMKPANGPLGRWRDRTVRRIVEAQWGKGLRPVNELRASMGLEPLDAFFDQCHRARRHLVLTSADFDLPGEMPGNARYVGAVLDDPTWAQDTGWTPPPGDEPLVLVALSSTFQDQAGCLQRVIDGLGSLPVRAVVTTGPALDPGALVARPGVEVVRSAPHSEVLRHATAVVPHGGHGTVVRALAAGVPMVVLPHGRDQKDNAVRVALRGAGLIRRRSASSKQIAAAVQRLMAEPAFAAGARRLGEVVRRDATSGALVGELEDLPARAGVVSAAAR